LDESGNERMMVPESKKGVLVVEGTVERLTGGGKFVVAPVRGYADVDVGNQVMIVVLDKLQQQVFVETLKERVTSPFPSNYAIVVKGNRFVEKCKVSYESTPLIALDPAGVAKYELPLPRDGVLYFRIPETVNVDNESVVEVRDGETVIATEKFGSIAVTPTTETYPTVSVSGRFSPANRADTYPASVEFTNTSTGQKFLAVFTNGEYSIQLPNRESYRATVAWNTVPGNRAGSASAGTLNLSANDHAFAFDVSW